MKKKVFMIALVLAVLAGALLWVWRNQGDISSVQRNIGDSAVYSRQEIQDAMEVAEKYFRDHFKGCKLLELTYDAKWRLREEEWADIYGVDQVILLTSRFYVGPDGGDGSLNQDSTYANWQWILVRSDGGKWEHRDHGYG